MPKPTRKQLARWLTQTTAKLADPTLDPAQRAMEEDRAQHLRRRLVGACSSCGRTLTDPKSVELGIGPECIERVRLDQADADDRETDRAQAHELSFG